MVVTITTDESRRSLHHEHRCQHHLVINNILIGMYGFCSGQSNMVHQVKLPQCEICHVKLQVPIIPNKTFLDTDNG
jgi:hypothetical protein